AHEPRASHAREQRDPRGPPRGRGRRGPRVGEPMNPVLPRAAGLVATVLTFWSCGGDTPLGPEAPRNNPNAAATDKKKTSATPPILVRVGLEQVEADRGGPLKGKKVGIIMHAASVTTQGRRTVEVLRTAGVEVLKIFAPEHGAQGKAAAGEKVGNEVDPLAR